MPSTFITDLLELLKREGNLERFNQSKSIYSELEDGLIEEVTE